MKHHTFPLIDRNGQRVIMQQTGEAGIIVHRGTCAYWVEFADRCEVRSAYKLDYLNESEQQYSSKQSTVTLKQGSIN
ncbi:hypothetical protein [Leptolyngbya sp. FACHB-711]|uniref:hypothetical protein n=1 Tax=Leptolyngbya sp. FACHB-711 TaxID=2692813 RepID=UPI0016874A90|nr:hypothetical protein [Leptolyngbya sp. FACHB-711]MBD2025258.1 hypothetical protein [Leptolyngbya sp. FACHB-711]